MSAKATKTVAVKTADGTKEAFVVADHATVDTGKAVGRYTVVGAKKANTSPSNYTEEAGKKSPTSSSIFSQRALLPAASYF